MYIEIALMYAMVWYIFLVIIKGCKLSYKGLNKESPSSKFNAQYDREIASNKISNRVVLQRGKKLGV